MAENRLFQLNLNSLLAAVEAAPPVMAVDALAGALAEAIGAREVSFLIADFNQLGYHQLEENRRPKGASDRIAIGAAGDDRLAVRQVMRLLDRLGFDPVDAGPLKRGVALEPDGSPIAATYTADQLSNLVSR